MCRQSKAAPPKKYLCYFLPPDNPRKLGGAELDFTEDFRFKEAMTDSLFQAGGKQNRRCANYSILHII